MHGLLFSCSRVSEPFMHRRLPSSFSDKELHLVSLLRLKLCYTDWLVCLPASKPAMSGIATLPRPIQPSRAYTHTYTHCTHPLVLRRSHVHRALGLFCSAWAMPPRLQNGVPRARSLFVRLASLRHDSPLPPQAHVPLYPSLRGLFSPHRSSQPASCAR